MQRDPAERPPAGAVALVVLAKAPVAGRVKTRLCPPCTPTQAAAIARAALADTLDAALGAAASPACRSADGDAGRVVLVLDGEPGPWLPPGVAVHPQVTGGLDRRLAGAFDAVGGPALLVGMDTPQVTPSLLADAAAALAAPGVDAVLGPAEDGGFWAVGLRRPDRAAFLRVPMGRTDTGARQLAALSGRGWTVADLPVLDDVDTFDRAVRVARAAPDGRFAAAVAQVLGGVADGPGPTRGARTGAVRKAGTPPA